MLSHKLEAEDRNSDNAFKRKGSKRDYHDREIDGKDQNQIHQQMVTIPLRRILDIIVRENPYYSQKYEEVYRKSLQEREEFWGEIGKQLTWTKPWDKVLDNSREPFTKW